MADIDDFIEHAPIWILKKRFGISKNRRMTRTRLGEIIRRKLYGNLVDELPKLSIQELHKRARLGSSLKKGMTKKFLIKTIMEKEHGGTDSTRLGLSSAGGIEKSGLFESRDSLDNKGADRMDGGDQK